MAKISYYLDKRKAKPVVKMLISARGKNAMLSMGVTLDNDEQWCGDSVNPIIMHPMASVHNSMMRHRMAAALDAMYQLEIDNPHYTIDDLKGAVSASVAPDRVVQKKNLVIDVWRKFMSDKNGRTFELYHDTLKRIEKYIGDDAMMRLTFEDITVKWLDGFDSWMAKSRGVNSRSIDMRNLRAVCNYAWKYDYTTQYIFKRWSIKREDGDVRPLTKDEFSNLFSYNLTGRPDLQMYRDHALLGFLLIGINMVDLHALTHDSLQNGYIRYERAKTHRKYCVKVEPEAQAIIGKYSGVEHLLSFADRYKTHLSFAQHLNAEGLQRIGPCRIESIPGSYHNRQRIVYNPIVKNMFYYRLRHTWAYFAANELDIPRDIIALCLGHGRKTVTDVYVQYDQRKIDEANRRVIDFAMSLIK